jgi:hypothetical protein
MLKIHKNVQSRSCKKDLESSDDDSEGNDDGDRDDGDSAVDRTVSFIIIIMLNIYHVT